ncbi:MAG: RluA family pseudouridine synthase [Chloroflexales bacterium]|nr:RluA family pseudouridine synthase [Chloroflexales bacterium]
MGTRLDRFVVVELPDLSRSFASQLITGGRITVNGAHSKPSYALRRGDTVSVDLPAPAPTDTLPENLPLDVVYEDADVVVVNKAAGMVVHPSAGHAGGTLVNALLYHYPDMQVGGDLRPGIVHRLDRDTSGLLVAVRNDRARHLINEQQQARTMRKAYLAVVDGRMKEPTGTIDAPIGRSTSNRLMQTITPSGRHARTHYRVLEDLGNYTLVEALLETGRTHQIRVHFASLHRPVLGDPLYGPKHPRSTFGLKRQFLHAYELGFVLPSSGEWRLFSAPLPEDLQTALGKLQANTGR